MNQETYGPEKKGEGIPLNLVSGAVRGLEEGRCLFHAPVFFSPFASPRSAGQQEEVSLQTASSPGLQPKFPGRQLLPQFEAFD